MTEQQQQVVTWELLWSWPSDPIGIISEFLQKHILLVSSSGNSEAASGFLFAPRLSISSILHCSVWIHISVWYQFLPAWRTSFEECWPLFWHTVKFLSDPFKVAVKLFPEQPEPRTILVTPPGVLGSLSSVLWGWWECKSFPALCGS